MLKYNSDQKLLTLRRIENPVEDLSPFILDDVKSSYEDFIEHALEDMEKFNELLAKRERVSNRLLFKMEDVQDTYRGKSNTHKEIRVRSDNPFDKGWIKAITLPRMDSLGKLHFMYNRKAKSIVNKLTGSDDISFSRDKLTIVLEGAQVTIDTSSKRGDYKVKVGNVEKSLLYLAGSLAARSGVQMDLSDYVDAPNALHVSGSSHVHYNMEMRLVADQLLERKGNITYLLDNLIQDVNYSALNIRKQLNSLCSLDKLVGEELFEDIGEYPAGSMISENVVSYLYANGYDKVKIKINIADPKFKVNEVIYSNGMVSSPRIINIPESLLNNPIIKQKGITKAGRLGFPIDFTGMYLTNDLIEILKTIGGVGVTNTSGKKQFNFYMTVCTNGATRVDGKQEYDLVNGMDPTRLSHLDLLSLMTCINYMKLSGKPIFKNRDVDFLKKLEMPGFTLSKMLKRAIFSHCRKYISHIENYVSGSHSGKGVTPFSGLQDEFFRLLSVESIATPDETNLVSEIAQATHANTILKRGDESVRNISLPYYGRICPFESPEGKKIGLTNNMAMGVKVQNGIMFARMLKVISATDTEIKLSPKIESVSMYKAQVSRITDITELQQIDKYTYKNSKVKAIVPNTQEGAAQMFSEIDASDLDYVSINSEAFVGVTTSMIPFACNTDAVRLSFGGKLLKAAIYLFDPDEPVVRTSMYEDILKVSNELLVRAEFDCYIDSIDENYIWCRDMEGKFHKIEIPPDKINSDSVLFMQVRVKIEQFVKKGDILISSSVSKNGVFSPGKNLLVAYCPYKHNHEDGIAVSENTATRMTSIGSSSFTERLGQDEHVVDIDGNRGKYISRHHSLCEIQCKDKSSNKASRRVYTKGASGIWFDSVKESEGKGSNARRVNRFYLMGYNKLKRGDKLSGRHGNKGVVTKVVPNSKGYTLNNGRQIDIYLNPHGVNSRMNISQVLETHCGLIATVLGISINSDAYNGASQEEIKALMKFTYAVANAGSKSKAESVINSSKLIPDSMKSHLIENVHNILQWAGVFDEEGDAYLWDPEAMEYLPFKVTIGTIHMLKLKQEADKKEHARSGLWDSEYSVTNLQPPQGGHMGGQAMGEMELYAIAAYGASEYLYEVCNEKSDNFQRKSAMELRSWGIDKLPEGIDEDDFNTAVYNFLYTMEGMGFYLESPEEGELPDTRIHKKNELVIPDIRNIKNKSIASLKLLSEEPVLSSADMDLLNKLKGVE